MSVAEQEKRATIVELKGKYDANNSKLKELESQRRHAEVSLRRAALTAAHLSDLPNDTPSYQPVGKAYFLQPKNVIMEHLEEVVKSTDKQFKSATKAQETLMQQQEGLASELNELFASLKKR